MTEAFEQAPPQWEDCIATPALEAGFDLNPSSCRDGVLPISLFGSRPFAAGKLIDPWAEWRQPSSSRSFLQRPNASELELKMICVPGET